jgi:hypothetical protein
LKYFTLCSCFRSVSFCTTDCCLQTRIVLFFPPHLHFHSIASSSFI